ncbi:MAG: DMT family transporter [Anaerolineaceae bacterium]|nr:DMT family transporter [Anaerolineaceae bacterium]
MTSIIYGILAAASWGACDFAGGIASRKSPAHQVVAVAWGMGLIIAPILALLLHEPMITSREWLFSASAGMIAVFGLLLLYQSMAEGSMSITIAVSGVTAAGLPVIAGAIMDGIPSTQTLIAIVLSMAAIWFVSQERNDIGNMQWNLQSMKNPLLAGLCFGSYFILMNQASQNAIFWPMVATRSAGLAVFLIFLWITKKKPFPPLNKFPLIAVNLSLDMVGTVFFILAGQVGRLDVASVLSSLYPGFAILLAWLILKEKLNRVQFFGIVLTLCAIGLFSMS